MGPTFVLMLREGLEASLIVGILLAYLRAIGRRDQFGKIGAGVAAAVAVSSGAAALLFFTASEFEGIAEQLFEGLAAIAAVSVLTWMIFWMRRHAVDIKRNLQDKMAEALNSPSKAGLAVVAFIVVLREGIETSLFLFATVKNVGAGAGTIGGLLGLTVAIALGIGIYKGGVRLNLSTFFTLTGGFLLVVAAGLAAHGVAELIEAGALPAGIAHIYNINQVFADSSGPGGFLKQLVGYSSSPSLLEVLVWGIYLSVTGVAFFRPVLRVRRAGVAAQNV